MNIYEVFSKEDGFQYPEDKNNNDKSSQVSFVIKKSNKDDLQGIKKQLQNLTRRVEVLEQKKLSFRDYCNIQ